MNLSDFVKIQDIKRFVDAVFGEKLPFTVDCSETIERSSARRADDRTVLKSFIASKNSDLIFTVAISEKEMSSEKYLPDAFGKPDYSRLLRERFKEINKVDIEYWNTEYNFVRTAAGDSNIHEIKLKFTVRYV